MDQSELKYAIRVDERAFFVRFYCWLYKADKSKINFCKLFWAYIFAAPFLCLRGLIEAGFLLGKGLRLAGTGLLLLGTGIAKAARFLVRPIAWCLFAGMDAADERNKRLRAQYKAEEAEREAEGIERLKKKTKEEPKPPNEFMQRGLGLVEHGGTATIMKYKAAAETARAARAQMGRTTMAVVNHVGEITSISIVGRGIFILAGCVGVAAVGLGLVAVAPTAWFLLTGLVHGVGWVGHGVGTAGAAAAEGTGSAAHAVFHSEISLWATVGLFGLVMFITLLFAAAAIGLPYLIWKHFLAPAGTVVGEVGTTVGTVVGKAGTPGVRVIDGGLRGFAQIMHLGYYAVKTSTCPRIEIEPRPDYVKTRTLEKETDLR